MQTAASRQSHTSFYRLLVCNLGQWHQLPLYLIYLGSLPSVCQEQSASACRHVIITEPLYTVTNGIPPGLQHGPFRQWLFLGRGPSPRFHSHGHLLFERSIGLAEPNQAHRIPSGGLQQGKPTPTPELLKPPRCQCSLMDFTGSFTPRTESYKGNLIQGWPLSSAPGRVMNLVPWQLYSLLQDFHRRLPLPCGHDLKTVAKMLPLSKMGDRHCILSTLVIT